MPEAPVPDVPQVAPGATVGVVTGPDGLPRCPWPMRPGGKSWPDYVDYHDREWGEPVRTEQALFERLTLEAFQSGLSWLTILRKRHAFHAAFAGFDPDAVAAFTVADVERLMQDAAIVRNRRKITATIGNARATLALRQQGGLAEVFWSARPPIHTRPRTMAQIAPHTPESATLARELKQVGFVHLGPTTLYAAMQACGVVDDHLQGCFRAEVGSTA